MNKNWGDINFNAVLTRTAVLRDEDGCFIKILKKGSAVTVIAVQEDTVKLRYDGLFKTVEGYILNDGNLIYVNRDAVMNMDGNLICYEEPNARSIKGIIKDRYMTPLTVDGDFIYVMYGMGVKGGYICRGRN